MNQGLGPDPNSLHQIPATISNPNPQVGQGVDIPQSVTNNWNQPPVHHSYWELVIVLIVALLVLIVARKMIGRAKAPA